MSQAKKTVVLAMCGVAIVVGLVVIVRSLGSKPQTLPTIYFSSDDGQTFIGLATKEVPPFTVDGKEVVRAMLYRDSNGKPFVGSLLKYSPEIKQAMETPPADTSVVSDADRRAQYLATQHGTLVKKPGAANWVPLDDPQAADALKVLDPSTHQPADPYIP